MRALGKNCRYSRTRRSWVHFGDTRSRVPWLVWTVGWLVSWLIIGATSAVSGDAPIRNDASGKLNGLELDVSGASVILNRVGGPVTYAISEVTPSEVMLHSEAVEFTLHILPRIQPGDAGIDRIELSVPDGLTDLAVQSISIGSVELSLGEEGELGEGEFSKVETSQFASLALGQRIVESETVVQIGFTADVRGPVGSATVECSMLGGGQSQNTTDGNANANPDDANSNSVNIISGVDPYRSLLIVEPPVVLADGRSESRITAVLLGADGLPFPGKTVRLASSRPGFDELSQPELPTDADGRTTGSIRSSMVGLSTLSAVDLTDGIPLQTRPQVAFSQGVALQIEKRANLTEAVIGDLVNFEVEVRNPGVDPAAPVSILDHIPANFKFLEGSARLDGVAVDDPVGNRWLEFDLGSVPAFEDQNGNGKVDPGEPGYVLVSYQLVVGAGAAPGDYTNTAVAVDACEVCYVSNQTEATVTVVPDPLFDVSTVLGTVFEDRNRNGRQDGGEPGVAGARVALDDGTITFTDEYGRYHFEAVEPGYRVVKLDSSSLPGVSESTTPESQWIWVTPGLLARAPFGVIYATESVEIGEGPVHGILLQAETSVLPIEIVGNVGTLSLVVNGIPWQLPAGDVQLRSRTHHGLIRVIGDTYGNIDLPLRFAVDLSGDRAVSEWKFQVSNTDGQVVWSTSGRGSPPSTLRWNGKAAPALDASGHSPSLRPGGRYVYQMSVQYADGLRFDTPMNEFRIRGGPAATSEGVLSGARMQLVSHADASNREDIVEDVSETFTTPEPVAQINGVAAAIEESGRFPAPRQRRAKPKTFAWR